MLRKVGNRKRRKKGMVGTNASWNAQIESQQASWTLSKFMLVCLTGKIYVILSSFFVIILQPKHLDHCPLFQGIGMPTLNMLHFHCQLHSSTLNFARGTVEQKDKSGSPTIWRSRPIEAPGLPEGLPILDLGMQSVSPAAITK